MYDDFYALIGQPKKVMGLDDLQALVHEGGRIDGDLLAHRPGGVSKRLLLGDRGELFAAPAAERSPGGGENDRLDRVRTGRPHKLEERRVLRVHRQDPQPFLGGQAGHERPRTDQALLVCQGQHPVVLERRQARFEPGEPDDGIEDDVGFNLPDEPRCPVRAAQHVDLRIERRRHSGRGL